jgi:hypothetical protein
MWLSEQLSELVSVFKELSKKIPFDFSLELRRLKIKKTSSVWQIKDIPNICQVSNLFCLSP